VSITAAFDALREVLSSSAVTLPPLLDQCALTLVKSLRAGGKVMVCGNGGSAADAQHFAAELVGRFEVDRPAIPAVALTVDSSVLTAIANDTGFEQVFARQVEALARPGDVLIGISTSGCSGNVLAAARAARARGCVVIGLTGAGGGLMADVCDLLIAVPSSSVARIQEIHILCLHALTGQTEALLGEVNR
jgi:D-sedoheptulose 7-phosphate isomerase